MKIPFSKIFKSQSKKIPSTVISVLDRNFPNSKNVEWEKKNSIYEAIFYLKDVVHIAQITKDGKLTEYKKNVWPDELPAEILKTGNLYGEIMNGIIIYKADKIFYEVIIRNENLDRFEFLFNQKGEVIKSKPL